ncbi:MAG: zinc ribbon domain-containing protein [Candidatus Woesebacteria bacterium]|nr:zinc ribbon domain-containing protein [Candidatus Woesebacteria bacterium]
MSEIPRHWRLNQQRYNLVGEKCPHCETLMFPPRDICIDCGQLAKEITGEIYSSLKISSPQEVSMSSK